MMKGVLDTRVEKLNGSDWAFWKQTIILELKCRALWNTFQFPLPISPTETQKSEDDKARLVILQMLERREFDKVSSATTAYDLFLKLQENNEGASALRKDRAAQEFHNFRKMESEKLTHDWKVLSNPVKTVVNFVQSRRISKVSCVLSSSRQGLASVCRLLESGKFDEMISRMKMEYHTDLAREGKEPEMKENAAFITSGQEKMFVKKSPSLSNKSSTEIICNFCQQ